jgi:predicted permease
MSISSIALNQIIVMFIIMLIGFICYKIKLIDADTNKKMSNILLMLVNPLIILVSYQREFSKELFRGLILSLVLGVITHLIAILISYILLRKKPLFRKKETNKEGETLINQDVSIERFSAIYSNCAFMGIPLINGIYGSEGVFYLTAYVTVFNILIWTHGVVMIAGKQDRKTTIKMLLSPTIFATIFGFLLFMIQIKFPSIILEAFTYVSNINTPLAMIIAGVTIGQTNILKAFTKLRLYYTTLIKLLIIPIVLLLLYSRFPIDKPVLITSILAVACPTAATGTLFALRFDKNALYASELFAITTIFSLGCIPLILTIAELLI